MAKALPHGMTANMMAIIGVEALGRASGGHYGVGSVNEKAKKLVANPQKKKVPHVCERCGAEIVLAPGCYRRKFCDSCIEEKRVLAKNAYLQRRHEEKERKVLPHRIEFSESGIRFVIMNCSVCGEEVKKRKYTENPYCAECAREARQKRCRARREKEKAERKA